MSLESIHESIEHEKRVRARLTEINRPRVRNALLKRGIATVRVTYEGSGDSGGIEDIVFRDKNGALRDVEGVIEIAASIATRDSEDREREIFFHGGMRYGPAPEDRLAEGEVRSTTAPLRDLIESLVYNLLESKHPGWEINEGSYGEFEWDLKTDRACHEHFVRFIEYSSYVDEDAWA